MCNNAVCYTMRRVKVFVKVTNKHTREDGFWIYMRIYWTIRDTSIMWDIIGGEYIYAKYAINR